MKGDANNSVHFVLEQYPPSLYMGQFPRKLPHG